MSSKIRGKQIILDAGSTFIDPIISGSLISTTDTLFVSSSLYVLNSLTASNATFSTASGSFSGSFTGDGSSLSGIATVLYLSASSNSSGQTTTSSLNLLNQSFTISSSYSNGLYARVSSSILFLDLAQSILTSSSPIYIGGTFTGHVTASSFSASGLVLSNEVYTTTVSASSNVITNVLNAISSVTTSIVSASTSVTTNNLYASSVSASSNIVTNNITASIISSSKIITGEVTSSVLTGSTFIFANSAKALQSIAMVDASSSYVPDLYFVYDIDSNTFFATSVIDGGSY